MRKWISLVCAGLLFAGVALALPVGLREVEIQVTDGATTAFSWTLAINDVDTTEAISMHPVEWPVYVAGRPTASAVFWLPRVVGNDLDSVFINVQYTHNDTTWIGSRWQASPLLWDTTSSDYAVAYSFIYADTTAGDLAFGAAACRMLLWQASNSDADNLDSLTAMKGVLIYKRAD